MSKMGSEKETIFTLYMVKHQNILEEELNLKMSEVVLEQSFDITVEGDVQKKRVLMLDMYAIERDLNVEIFVENILTKSNDDHQRRLLKIIERLEKGIIIYQALGFREKDVQELRLAVEGKDINLYFVQINPEIIPLIYKLDTELHKLKVSENLSLFHTIPNPIRLLNDISFIKEMEGKKTFRKKGRRDLSNRQEINEFLLEQLRLGIPYFFPFQKSKTIREDNCILQFGGGKSGITLAISPKSRGKAFVELRFKENSPIIYKAIKEKEQIARERIGEELKFIDDDYKITFQFQPYKDVQMTINKLVQIAERFIQAFSNYTFYWDKKEMWQQHKAGI
ncbi:hypothetical protein QIX46_02115 [Lysinibacillus boronitolerans]|nr:hypothetical protein QIX46_02115 [Lysinibacillus boronitolerans]